MIKKPKMELQEIEKLVSELVSENHSSSSPFYKLINSFPDTILKWQEIGLYVPIAHYLVQQGLIKELKYLQSKIPDALKQISSYDESLLYTSLKFENYDIARYLLQLDMFQEFGYNTTKGGQTPLSIACDTFQAPHDVIHELLKKSKPDQDELKLSLHNAIKCGNHAGVILLLEHDNALLNAQLNSITEKYFMHLLLESQFNRENIFPEIWEKYQKKIDWTVVDRQRSNIFHYAIRYQIPLEYIFSLLDLYKKTFASNINVQDGRGNTILHVAIAWHDVDVVKYCCEELGMNPRIRNYDNENGLKAAVYRASLGQWELFDKKIEYLIRYMFGSAHGTFSFDELIDSVSLESLNRYYETRHDLYPIIIKECYLKNNQYADIIKDFLAAFKGTPAEREAYYTCFYLHDQAVLEDEDVVMHGREHETHRRKIINNLVNCIVVLIYRKYESFETFMRVIRALREIPGFKYEPNDFMQNIALYVPLRIQHGLKYHETKGFIEFYKHFDEMNLINFDVIIRKVFEFILHKPSDLEVNTSVINSKIFNVQLNLTNTISNVSCTQNIYNTQEFELVKYCLEQKDFNLICRGRELLPLKVMCRPICRRLVLNENIKWKDRSDAIKSLGLPTVLENFLQYA